jgi:membrane protease subunit HflC
LRAYDKLLDDKTTIFLPADAYALRMLHFDRQPDQVGPSPPTIGELSIGADLLQNKKREEEAR